MPLSEARKKANNKYITEKLDEFKVRVPKGQKAVIQDYAKSKAKSLNYYIVDLINNDMNDK